MQRRERDIVAACLHRDHTWTCQDRLQVYPPFNGCWNFLRRTGLRKRTFSEYNKPRNAQNNIWTNFQIAKYTMLNKSTMLGRFASSSWRKSKPDTRHSPLSPSQPSHGTSDRSCTKALLSIDRIRDTVLDGFSEILQEQNQTLWR